MKTTRLQCSTKALLRPSLFLILSAFLLSCCSPVPDQRVLLKEDFRPPVFTGAEVPDSRRVILRFSEPVELLSGCFSSTPLLSLETAHPTGRELELFFSEEMSPGQEYSLEVTVADPADNTHTLLAKVYGFNPRIPEIRLNEITTQGSTSNPDKVELEVLSEGNTAGLVLFEGTVDFQDQYKVFPPVEVNAGDYLVVHFKPTGSLDEVDETETILQCRAADASDYAWDFWVDQGEGLSGNNGVISLYSHTAGELLDGFLYSNRNSGSDTDYRGFGSSAVMAKADQLWLQEGWQAAGNLIAPEDGVNPDDSTATRSMGRLPGAADTDSAADWIIVDTGESSFGYENSTVEYLP